MSNIVTVTKINKQGDVSVNINGHEIADVLRIQSEQPRLLDLSDLGEDSDYCKSTPLGNAIVTLVFEASEFNAVDPFADAERERDHRNTLAQAFGLGWQIFRRKKGSNDTWEHAPLITHFDHDNFDYRCLEP